MYMYTVDTHAHSVHVVWRTLWSCVTHTLKLLKANTWSLTTTDRQLSTLDTMHTVKYTHVDSNIHVHVHV